MYKKICILLFLLFTITSLHGIIFAQDLIIKYKCGETESTVQNIKPSFIIYNYGNGSVKMSGLKVRYYRTNEGGEEVITIYWAQIGSSNVKGTAYIGYIEFSFSDNTGSIPCGGNSGIVNAGIHHTDWSDYIQTNDSSFDGNITSFTDYNKMELYYNGTLVWGPGSVRRESDPTPKPQNPPREISTETPAPEVTGEIFPKPTKAPVKESIGCDRIFYGRTGYFNTTGAYCFKTRDTINGWGALCFSGRTVSVTINGEGTAVTGIGGPLPSKEPEDYYLFECSAGDFSWASIYWW